MDVTSFAFGTIALVGPLASACLSAYGLLKDIRSIDDDAADFRLHVDTQMALLSLWVKTWVHFDPCADTTAMPQLHKSGKLRAGAVSSIGEGGCLIVVRILTKISKTLADARTLQSVYGIQLTPIPMSGKDKVGASSAQREIGNLQVEIITETPLAELHKTGSPEVVSMSSTSTSASATLASQARVKDPDHGLRSWLRRASCRKLCTRDMEEEGPTARKAVSDADTKGHQRMKLPSTREAPPNPVPNLQMLDTIDNITVLEAAKEDILDNLSKIQCLRWALSDKEKGMALARELQQWNENLFKILPLKRLETPGKIRAGKHYTPPQSSPLFTGRTEILDFLENVFFAREPKPRQRKAVLHGLGGAGKTQIALKFAEEHINQFDSIFWVNATTDNTVEESFREIAEHLNISGRHLVNAVRHRLGSLTDYNYLLIFDNADNLPTLSTYFPGGKHGNILVTSRNPRTTDIVSDINKQAFEVDRMSQSDAYDLLRRAARLSPEEFSRPETQKVAQAIVEKLGYLALAIEQAGAYIANTCSIGDYLGIYDKIRPMLMNTREFQGSGYAASVYQTWELSLRAVKGRNPAAAELLVVLGYFHYEGIPREIFETGCAAFVRASDVVTTTGGTKLSQLGTLLVESVAKCDINSYETKLTSPDGSSNATTWVPFRFDQAMETLCSYSLVKQRVRQDGTSPSYTIHPLVHCWIRDRCEPNPLERQRARCTAIALLQEAMFTNEDQGGYVLRSRLVSHLDAWVRPYLDTQKAWICGHTEEERMGVLEAAAKTYHEIGRLDDAESLRERILEWRVRCLGAEDSSTARARVDLAMTYREKGSFEKATLLDEETLQLLLQSESQGPEHPETLQAMLNLAWTYAAAGNVAGAEKLEREVIAVRRKLNGPDSLEVAVARGNLGVTLWRQARYLEAEEELGFALEKKLAVYGKDHPSTILTMGNLASALRGEKRWMAAEELGREVIKIRMSILGEKHKDVARAMANLGVTLLEAGRAAEAHDLQVEALEMLKEAVGDYHVHTIDALENLGRSLIELGRDVEAVEVLGELVSKRKMVLGEAHPATLVAMKILGGLKEQEVVLNEVKEIERKESERQKIDKENREGLAGQTMLITPANNGVAKAQVGSKDALSAESKKRRDELVSLGLYTDRWNIVACS